MSPMRPRHMYGIDALEEDVIEVREHGDEERQGLDASPEESQLQGAKGVGDGFETPDEGNLSVPTHVEGNYGQMLDWGRGERPNQTR